MNPDFLFMLDLEARIKRLGGNLLEQAGEIVITLGDELADELEREGQELLDALREGVRRFGGEVRDVARGVALRLPSSDEQAEQAEAKKPSAPQMTAVLSKQLFEIAEVWESLGLKVRQDPNGDLVFCRPIPGPRGEPAGEVCAKIEGGLIRRVLKLGATVAELVIKTILRRVGFGGAR